MVTAEAFKVREIAILQSYVGSVNLSRSESLGRVIDYGSLHYGAKSRFLSDLVNSCLPVHDLYCLPKPYL
jgi:hypothetical protein